MGDQPNDKYNGLEHRAKEKIGILAFSLTPSLPLDTKKRVQKRVIFETFLF
jgi:hypothetical protein